MPNLLIRYFPVKNMSYIIAVLKTFGGGMSFGLVLDFNINLVEF